MKNELVLNPIEFGIEESQALELTKGLSTILSEREVLKDAYLDVIEMEITQDNLSVFKELRLKIRDNRTKGIEKWHTANKAYFLAGGRFVDAIKNKESLVNNDMEEKLMNAEKHFENLEKERIAKIQSERIEQLTPFVESTENLLLSDMDEDVWNAYLSTKKQQFEDKKAAEEKAEADRLEALRIEAERIKAQEIENARLKAEAEKREREIEAERKKNAEIQAKKDAEAKAERERIEAENKAKLDAERKERERIERELKAKQDAELKIEKERIEAEKLAKIEAEKLAKAPIKKQLKTWILSLTCGEPPILDDTVKDILVKFESFREWSLKEIDKL